MLRKLGCLVESGPEDKMKNNPVIVLRKLKSLGTSQQLPLFGRSLSDAQRLRSSYRRDMGLFFCRKTETKYFVFRLLTGFKVNRGAKVSRVSFEIAV